MPLPILGHPAWISWAQDGYCYSWPSAIKIRAILNTWFRTWLRHLFQITCLCHSKHYAWAWAIRTHAIMNTCSNVRKIADSRARPACIKNSLVALDDCSCLVSRPAAHARVLETGKPAWVKICALALSRFLEDFWNDFSSFLWSCGSRGFLNQLCAHTRIHISGMYAVCMHCYMYGK